MQCNVYFIEDNYGHIKIGVANNVDSRLNDLSVAHAEPLQLLALIRCCDRDTAFLLESYLHNLFKSHRLLGEWFDARPIISWLSSNIFLINEVLPEEINNIPRAKKEIDLYKLLAYGRLLGFMGNSNLWYPASQTAYNAWNPPHSKVVEVLSNTALTDDQKCAKLIDVVLNLAKKGEAV